MKLFRLIISSFACNLFFLWWPISAVLSNEIPEIAIVRPDKIKGLNDSTNYQNITLQRDPFNWSREQISTFKDQEPQQKVNSIEGLTLNGIIWDEKNQVAIVNNRILAVGDFIGAASILEIQKDMIVIKKNERYHTLWLEEMIIKLNSADGDF